MGPIQGVQGPGASYAPPKVQAAPASKNEAQETSADEKAEANRAVQEPGESQSYQGVNSGVGGKVNLTA